MACDARQENLNLRKLNLKPYLKNQPGRAFQIELICGNEIFTDFNSVWRI